jgi:hypothetical protein
MIIDPNKLISNINMGGLSIILLFSKDRTKEPPGIFQCETSGEYFPYYLYVWRDGVHYLYWCEFKKLNPRQHSSYTQWSKIYGYDREEEFVGNLNEFIDRNDLLVCTSIGTIESSDNLQCKSAWDDSMCLEDYNSESD